MPTESNPFSVRRPRHEALQDSACAVWVERIGRDPGAKHEATLVDVSRLGLQVSLAAPLEADEPLAIHIRHSQAGLSVALAARARWQRQTPDGRWAVGCVFDRAIDPVVLGELFLCGVLSTQA